MKRIMNLSDLFVLVNRGLVIIGTDEELDRLNHEQIRSLIGDQIVVQRSDGRQILVGVQDVDVSTSLVGRKNVSILVKEDVKKGDLEIGAEIYRA